MKEKLDNIHHLAIQVKDIAKAVSWYTNNYNCEVDYQDNSWAMLKFENTCLALVLADDHPYHFAILTEHCNQYGTPQEHRDGTKSVYIKDLDHNSVEMLELPRK